MSFGEYIVTLEDVYMLLGLSVEGIVVNGRVNQDNRICKQLLGVALFEDTEKGQGINLKYLKQHYSNMILTKDSTENEKIMKMWCYIMLLFGNFLFPETTGNTVNIMYLALLRDINKIRTYSWGSTILSHLYSLCVKMYKRVLNHFIV